MLDRTNIAASVLLLLRQFTPGLPRRDEAAARASLPAAGLTSMAAVKLMLALEAEFDMAIPDEDLIPENFADLDAICALVNRLRLT